MKKVQQAGDYSIYQKRSGRYGVKDKTKEWVNAEDKERILREAGLIRVAAPKPVSPDQPEESASGEAAGGEASAT